MACQLCKLETSATLCQVCQVLAELSPARGGPSICRHCKVPIAEPAESGTLCRLCRDLLKIVRNSSWLAYAHAEWDQENFLLAKRKQELLGQGGSQ